MVTRSTRGCDPTAPAGPAVRARWSTCPTATLPATPITNGTCAFGLLLAEEGRGRREQALPRRHLQVDQTGDGQIDLGDFGRGRSARRGRAGRDSSSSVSTRGVDWRSSRHCVRSSSMYGLGSSVIRDHVNMLFRVAPACVQCLRMASCRAKRRGRASLAFCAHARARRVHRAQYLRLGLALRPARSRFRRRLHR